MELKNISDRNPHTLSGGQKQRVIILSALLSDKKILFFDEPTSGMDYKTCLEYQIDKRDEKRRQYYFHCLT